MYDKIHYKLKKKKEKKCGSVGSVEEYQEIGFRKVTSLVF